MFAIRRLNPDITETSNEELPDRDLYEQCMSACAKLLDILDSVTPELVTYSFLGHWADRDQCQERLVLLNRGKDKFRAISNYAGEMQRVLEELHGSLLQQLPHLVVRKILVGMDDILDKDIKDKLNLVNVASETVKAVLCYLCDCCYAIIEDFSLETESPSFYCGCVRTTITCSTCGLLIRPCGHCAAVKDIFKLMKAIDVVDVDGIASSSFTDFFEEISTEGEDVECVCFDEEDISEELEEEESDWTLEFSDIDSDQEDYECVIM